MAYYQIARPEPDGWGWDRADDVPAGLVWVVSSLNRMRRNVLDCVEGLTHEEVWTRIGPDVCAAGNLLLHLRGSEHQWIGHKIGARPLERDRDAEFAARGGYDLSTLVEGIKTSAAETREVLASLDEAAVEEHRSEDGFSIPFILHYTNQHYSLHLGQLVMIREYLSPGFRLY